MGMLDGKVALVTGAGVGWVAPTLYYWQKRAQSHR